MRDPILKAYLKMMQDEQGDEDGPFDDESILKTGILNGLEWSCADEMKRNFEVELANVRIGMRNTRKINAMLVIYGTLTGTLFSALTVLVLETYFPKEKVVLSFIGFVLFVAITTLTIRATMERNYRDLKFQEESYVRAIKEINQRIEDIENFGW